MTVFKHNQVNGLSQVIDHTFMMISLALNTLETSRTKSTRRNRNKEQILFPLWQKDWKMFIMYCPPNIVIPILTRKMFIVYAPPNMCPCVSQIYTLFYHVYCDDSSQSPPYISMFDINLIIIMFRFPNVWSPDPLW